MESKTEAKTQKRKAVWESAKARALEKHGEILEGMKSRNESKKALKKMLKKLVTDEIREMKKSGEIKEEEGEEVHEHKPHPSNAKRKSETGEESKRKKHKLQGKVVKTKLRERIKEACSRGPEIVIDMSFSDQGSLRTRASLIRQIQEIYSCNLTAPHPCKILICGASADFRKDLEERQDISAWEEQGTIVVTDKQFYDVVEKDNLVYMSSEAPKELDAVQPNKTYVIGGIVDRNSLKGTTANKASELGIESRRLPLDSYLDKRGRNDAKKVLTVNQVARIIQDFAATKSWDFTFDRNVPNRLNETRKRELRKAHGYDPNDKSVDILDLIDRSSTWRFVESKPKTVVVCGASSGIGLAFSLQFRRMGWNVVMVARNLERLESAAEQVREEQVAMTSNVESKVDPIVLTIAEDCSDLGGVARIVSTCIGIFLNGIDGIVATSGLFRWDDDKDLAEDPQLLLKQNFYSRVLVFSESLRLLNVPATYRRKDKTNFSDFDIQPLPEADKLGKNDASAFFVCVGSAAGAPGFTESTKNTENETKYIEAMSSVHGWCSKVESALQRVAPQLTFRLVEPPLLDTPLARSQFSRLNIEWDSIPRVHDYVADVIKDLAL